MLGPFQSLSMIPVYQEMSSLLHKLPHIMTFYLTTGSETMKPLQVEIAKTMNQNKNVKKLELKVVSQGQPWLATARSQRYRVRNCL